MIVSKAALPCPGAESKSGSFLYFLVSVARSGSLAGAFKLGIADSFAARYHQHTRTWEEHFDLGRSVLLCTNRRQEVLWLEKYLKRLFGEPGPDGRSWRRDPGRQADGYTEWFELDCLELMLEHIQSSIAIRSKLGVFFRVVRGISPADCALVGLAADGTPLPPQPGSQVQRNALAHARREQEKAVEAAQDATMAGAVLELAQVFEQHLLWVSLKQWRLHIENIHACSVRIDVGWADLYFGRFGPPRPKHWMRSVNDLPPPPAQIRFEEAYERMMVTVPDGTEDSRWKPEETCWLVDAVYSTLDTARTIDGVEALGPFPHPICADSVVLRLNFRQSESVCPFFAQYETLAQNVGHRHCWEQPYQL